MARTRAQKEATVAGIAALLGSSKVTVFARYSGTPVKAMQQLRRDTKEGGTHIRIIKNRLFKRALAQVEELKEVDSTEVKGQLLYAFNPNDEADAARGLGDFAKTNPQIEFVGAITSDGKLLSADEVKQLASLPAMPQLRATLVGMLSGPSTGLVSVLSANLRGVANVLSSRSKALEVK